MHCDSPVELAGVWANDAYFRLTRLGCGQPRLEFVVNGIDIGPHLVSRRQRSGYCIDLDCIDLGSLRLSPCRVAQIFADGFRDDAYLSLDIGRRNAYGLRRGWQLGDNELLGTDAV